MSNPSVLNLVAIFLWVLTIFGFGGLERGNLSVWEKTLFGETARTSFIVSFQLQDCSVFYPFLGKTQMRGRSGNLNVNPDFL